MLISKCNFILHLINNLIFQKFLNNLRISTHSRLELLSPEEKKETRNSKFHCYVIISLSHLILTFILYAKIIYMFNLVLQ